MVMKMEKIRIVFMGTADFSKAVLEMLIAENYNIVGVVSQPDRPVGRKHILKPTLVKEVALEHQLPCIQPEKIKTDYQAILDLKPDLIITAAYGQIVPKAILEAPRLGCINVHASLLPKLREGHRFIMPLLTVIKKQVLQSCIWLQKWTQVICWQM